MLGEKKIINRNTREWTIEIYLLLLRYYGTHVLDLAGPLGLVVGVLVLVAGDVAVALGVHPACLPAALAVVVEALPVGAAVLGRVGQTVSHRALLDGLELK